MLLSYLKHAFRLLVRNPFFTAINVLGLSVGLAAFFILWDHASSGLSSDQHLQDADQIFRLESHWHHAEGHTPMSNIRSYQFAMILNDFPQIKEDTWFIKQSFFLHNEETLGYSGNLHIAKLGVAGENVIFKETKAIIAKPNLFEFFSIPLVQGKNNEILQAANTVVLSENAARRFFGSQNPIGQSLVVNEDKIVTVTGVFENLTSYSTHLDFEFVFSGADLKAKLDEPIEYRPWTQCYVKLDPVSNRQSLQTAINQNMEKYWGLYFEFYGRAKAEIVLLPIAEVAFAPYAWGDPSQPKSKLVLKILKLVAILIIIMAWINYINLSIARMLKRQKEIAARKIAGALSENFFWQFMTESMIINLIALLAAFTGMQLIRVPLNSFFQIHLSDFGQITISTWLAMTIVTISGIMLTALYPAHLSVRYNPRDLLRHTGSFSRWSLSSWLTTSQYAGAFVLIVFGFLVYLQLNLVLHKYLGFDASKVVIIEVPVRSTLAHENEFHTLLTTIRNRHEATYSHSLPGDERQGEVRLRNGKDVNGAISLGGVDETFLPFFKIKLLAGRNFVPNDRSDACILSRRSIQRLGYKSPESSIGSRIQVDDGRNISFGGVMGEMEIIGVTEDFMVDPTFVFSNSLLFEGICLFFGTKSFHHLPPARIAVRMESHDLNLALKDIRRQFQDVFPELAMDWYFIDSHFNKGYDHEKTTRNQIGLFTALAIGISCLGMLGMIATKAERKTKELGIRKVLGANLAHLAGVLLRDTIRHLVVAVLIGIPLAYYAGRLYLDKYSERIDLMWWHLTLPVVLLLFIMFSTITFLLVRAMKANPTEALKYE